MRLDRNIEGNEGRGKYALLKLRTLALCERSDTFAGLHPDVANALSVLEREGILDWGNAETESEFFVIRLKDKHANAALKAYAASAAKDDREWGEEVNELAHRAGHHSPFCKQPD